MSMMVGGLLIFIVFGMLLVQNGVVIAHLSDTELQFWNWTEKMNFSHLDNFELFTNKWNVRGIRATKDMKKDEIILSVPENGFLSYELSFESVHFNETVMNKVEQTNVASSIRLAWFISHEYIFADQSIWTPYIHLLPNDLPAPFAIPYSAYYALSRSPFMSSFLNVFYHSLIETLDLLRIKVFPDLVDQTGISIDELERIFIWGHCMVTSRAWGNVANHETTLLPIADLANHDHDEDGIQEILNSTAMKAGLKLKHDVKRGEEIFLSYSPRVAKCKISFYINWGFVPRSAIDCSTIHFNAASSHPAIAAILKSRGVEIGVGMTANINTTYPFPEILLDMCRWISETDVDVGMYARMKQMYSVQNEILALSILGSKIETLFQNISSTDRGHQSEEHMRLFVTNTTSSILMKLLQAQEAIGMYQGELGLYTNIKEEIFRRRRILLNKLQDWLILNKK